MILSTRRVLLLAAVVTAFVLAPAAADAAKISVICKDGTADEGGRGACSGHGGIDKAATAKAETKRAAEEKAAKAKAKKEMEEARAKEKIEKVKGQAEAKGAKAKAKLEKEAEGGEVTCKDGTTAKAGRGACSGHGGVDRAGTVKAGAGAATTAVEKRAEHEGTRATRAAEGPAAAARGALEKADPAKGPPTARCKDGTLSYSEHHTGACSRHGGVEEWLDKK